MSEGVDCVSNLNESTSDKFCVGCFIAQFMEHLGDLCNLLCELAEAPAAGVALSGWDGMGVRDGSRFG